MVTDLTVADSPAEDYYEDDDFGLGPRVTRYQLNRRLTLKKYIHTKPDGTRFSVPTRQWMRDIYEWRNEVSLVKRCDVVQFVHGEPTWCEGPGVYRATHHLGHKLRQGLPTNRPDTATDWRACTHCTLDDASTRYVHTYDHEIRSLYGRAVYGKPATDQD